MNMKIPKGIYRDRLFGKRGEYFDSGWCSNIIVDRCRELIAALMAGSSVAQGIRFIAIGQGDSAWDTTPPAAPTSGSSALQDTSPFTMEVNMPQITLEYLNAGNVPVAGPTNRLQVTITLEAGTPPLASGEETYPMREFGLFGRIDTDEYMIDYVRHPVIHKGPDDTLLRTIRLIF